MENKSPRHLGYLPRASISLRAAVWSVMTGIGFALPAIYLITLIPLPEPTKAIAAGVAKRAATFGLLPLVLMLKSLLIYPVLEEAVYRGLMLPVLRKYLPAWIAVLVPTLIFAFTHIGSGFTNVVFALLAGLLFSWLVLRSRSLWPAMLCHCAVNLAVVWVFGPFLRARGLTGLSDMLEPLALILLAGSLVLFAAGMRILRGEFSRPPPPARRIGTAPA